MRLLAFTDTHSSLKSLNKIRKLAKKAKPDLMVCAGDISVFEEGLDQMLKSLNKIKMPLLIIDGNHESVSRMKKAARKYKNIIYLHKNTYKKDGFVFFGYGGGGFAQLNKELEKEIKKHKDKLKKKKLVVITHAPPFNTKLDQVMKNSCGCKSIRKVIKKYKPELAVCGHLHENSRKQDYIKKTRVVNPGPDGKIIRI